MVGVGGDVHVLGAVAERAEVAGLQEARAGVCGLGAVDAVELGRVADRLVHLELHLLVVDHDGRHPGGALVRAEQRGRLLRDPRRLRFESEALDVLPPGLRARADVGARVGAELDDPVADRHRLHAAAALDELLVDLDPVGGEEELSLALGAQRRLGDLDVGVAQRLLDAQAERDLVVERNGEGVSLDRRPVRAGARLERRERPRLGAAGRGGEPAGAERSVARSLGREPAVGGEPPGAADEHPHADPFALAVAERLDAAVLRPDRLRAPDDRSRIGVARAGPEGGVDGGCTRVAHLCGTLPRRYNAVRALVAELVDAQG